MTTQQLPDHWLKTTRTTKTQLSHFNGKNSKALKPHVGPQQLLLLTSEPTRVKSQQVTAKQPPYHRTTSITAKGSGNKAAPTVPLVE